MILLNQHLTLTDFESILFEGNTLAISEEVMDKVYESFVFLKFFSQNKIIYGVNTGFGPMAQYRIDDKDATQLQYNLIRSHASGTGNYLAPAFAKAVIIARLNTLAKGNSGVHPSLIYLMTELVNRDINPVIYEHGGVGASGDLVQLAHLALALIGEGEVLYQGKKMPAQEVFKLEKLHPITIESREGLALMNGTSVMTGIGIINLYYAKKLIHYATLLSSALNEIVRAYDDHFSEELNAVKLHPGQREIACKMRENLADSPLIRKREEDLYSGKNSEKIFKEKVQEYYSLRCIPQILGPILDTVNYTAQVLENELNSANDNPIIDVPNKQVFHGGNFHGDYIALEMDKLKLAITKLTMLSERQINYMMNSKLNEILPPFVNLGTLGFNFGMQGVQFTATSTTAESQALATSMYVHSIPCNNDNQDIVSMGTNAASMTARVIDNAFEVLSIQLISTVQAISYLGYENQTSTATRLLVEDIRKIIPIFKEDIPMYPYISQIKEYLKNK